MRNLAAADRHAVPQDQRTGSRGHPRHRSGDPELGGSYRLAGLRRGLCQSARCACVRRSAGQAARTGAVPDRRPHGLVRAVSGPGDRGAQHGRHLPGDRLSGVTPRREAGPLRRWCVDVSVDAAGGHTICGRRRPWSAYTGMGQCRGCWPSQAGRPGTHMDAAVHWRPGLHPVGRHLVPASRTLPGARFAVRQVSDERGGLERSRLRRSTAQPGRAEFGGRPQAEHSLPSLRGRSQRGAGGAISVLLHAGVATRRRSGGGTDLDPRGVGRKRPERPDLPSTDGGLSSDCLPCRSAGAGPDSWRCGMQLPGSCHRPPPALPQGGPALVVLAARLANLSEAICPVEPAGAQVALECP